MSNWNAVSNCSIAIDPTVGFASSTPPNKSSLKVTCTVTGTIKVAYTPSLPLTVPSGQVWGFHALGSAAFPITAKLDALDVGNNLTNTSSMTKTLDTVTWHPFQGATGSKAALSAGPTTHGSFYITAAMTAGQVFWLDLVGVFKSNAQILIDWLNPAFGTSPTGGNDFVDLTGRARFDSGATVTLQRGRQDNISEIQPGQAQFSLQNDDGWFTPQLSASPWFGYIDLGPRVQINTIDDAGAWHTRFDGTISQLDYTIDPTGNTNLCRVSCSDALAYLNRWGELQSWTAQTVLTTSSLLYHWALNDDGTSRVFIESSGNSGPSLRPQSCTITGSTPGTITYQDTTGGVETQANAGTAGVGDGSQYWSPGTVRPSTDIRGLVSAVSGPYTTPESSANLGASIQSSGQVAQNAFLGTYGYMAEGVLPAPIAPTATGADFAVEGWVMPDPGIAANKAGNYGPFIAIGLGSTKDAHNIVSGIYYTGGSANWETAYYAQPPGFAVGSGGNTAPSPTSSVTYPINMSLDWGKPLPHHLVINITGDPSAPTLTTYIDNNLVGTVTLRLGQSFDTISIGGPYGGLGNWWGNLSRFSVYSRKLTTNEIASHCAIGQYGYWESPTDNCIAAIAAFAKLPPFWSNLAANYNGLTLTEYQDISGQDPLSAMQVFENAEMGLLFVDAAGKLNFHTRDYRMGKGAPDLTLPTDTYTPDMGYNLVDQFLVNSATSQSPTTQSTDAAGVTTTSGVGVSATAIDQASANRHGSYFSGTPKAPNQVPLISWSRVYATTGLVSYQFHASPNFTDNVQWQVNRKASPRLQCKSLAVDARTLDPTSGITLAQLYALEIDQVVAVSGLPVSYPDQAGANDFFIEGIDEEIGQDVRTIKFYTSPASQQRAWKPGDSTYGVLGSTAVVGVSAPDVSAGPSKGKDVGHDGGRPYWPPGSNTGAPQISSSMNNPAGNGHGFIGANDLRGITDNLSLKLNPPMFCVAMVTARPTYASGTTYLGPQWDTVYIDTQSGMGAYPGYANWYCCLVPGFYEFSCSWVWGQTANTTGTREVCLLIANQGTTALATGGSLSTSTSWMNRVDGHLAPQNSGASRVTVNTYQTRAYLGIGDLVSVSPWQDSGSSQAGGTSYGGSMFSGVWIGWSTGNDQYQNN